MKNCPNCGKELYDFALRCDGCGLRGLMNGQVTNPIETDVRKPSKMQVVVDLPECPKLPGYYCSKDPANCHKLILKGVCYSCEDAIFKAAYHRKINTGAK